MHNLDKIKDKLRKLLMLSDGVGASQGEIDNAMAAATRLMTQHNLTREDVDMHAQDPTKNVKMGRSSSVSLGRNFSTWESMLCQFVTKFIGYASYYSSPSVALKKNGLAVLDEDGKQRFGSMVYFFGAWDNCEACVEIYEELRDTIQAMALLLHGGWFRGDGAVYCQGFCVGLVETYTRSVKQLKQHDEQTTALVLADEQNQLAIAGKANNWLRKKHGVKLRTTSMSGANGSSAAFNQGRKDGASYNPSRPTPQRKLA